ncbi:MAG: 50S ribosomal protein L11 methyltransferase [Actinobacteria bacterium]|nr:50S ribosomal protein L11 methyltransferase [Actinomycetota bacterium]
MSQTSTQMEWKGRTGPFTVLLNPGVFSPTHTSRTLADALEIGPDDTVVDVGCGSGVLSFVAARLGAKRVIGCDISQAAVEAARANAVLLGLSDRVEFRTGSLLDPVRDVRADVLIGDVSGIPDEIARMAGWFPEGRAGGPHRRGAAAADDRADRRDARSRRAAVPSHRHDPGRAQDHRGRPAAVRRQHGGGDRPGVPASRHRRQIGRGGPHDEGGTAEPSPARQPMALAPADLALRANLTRSAAGRVRAALPSGLSPGAAAPPRPRRRTPPRADGPRPLGRWPERCARS